MVQGAYPQTAQGKRTESHEFQGLSGYFQGVFRVFFPYALSGYALSGYALWTKKVFLVAFSDPKKLVRISRMCKMDAAVLGDRLPEGT